jgi:signal transduction histidine kinase
VVNTHSAPAEKKGIKILQEVDPAMPILNLDDAMLRRALNNLVDNAVKYTPENGTITVGAAVQDHNLLLTVKDSGLGITEENQKILFERFRRVRRREHHGVKGSGLGLFIVRGVALRHGGDAFVESKEGQGSKFSIKIPLEGPNLLGGDSKKP